MTELWLPVKGYEGLYEISNLLIVRKIKKGGVFIPAMHNKDGYLCIDLRKDGKAKKWGLHRLIAMAFIPNPQNKPYINHKNGIKNDNRIENLEWCTTAENNWHAREMGLRKKTYPQKIINVSHQNQIKVAQYSISGDLIGVFGTIIGAAASIDRSPSLIHKAMYTPNTTCAGYLWKVYGEDKIWNPFPCYY